MVFFNRGIFLRNGLWIGLFAVLVMVLSGCEQESEKQGALTSQTAAATAAGNGSTVIMFTTWETSKASANRLSVSLEVSDDGTNWMAASKHSNVAVQVGTQWVALHDLPARLQPTVTNMPEGNFSAMPDPGLRFMPIQTITITR